MYGFKITHRGENRQVRAIIQNIADIPGGVTVAIADLIPGVPLRDGTAIGKGSDGLYHVIKTAAIAEAAGSTAKTYKVEKGHHFKVGDVLAAGVGAAGYAITAIDQSNTAYDSITVGTTLGELAKGATVVQGAAAGASAALKYTPSAVVGEPKDVVAGDNLWVPAIVIGTVKGDVIPPYSAATIGALKGIVVI